MFLWLSNSLLESNYMTELSTSCMVFAQEILKNMNFKHFKSCYKLQTAYFGSCSIVQLGRLKTFHCFHKFLQRLAVLGSPQEMLFLCT